MSLHRYTVACAVALLLTLQTANAAIDVTKIVNDYGNVGPNILNSSLNSFRTNAAAPWYVTFNLVQDANVDIGALGLSGNGGSFTLTFLRLLDDEGNPIVGPVLPPFDNPFPDPIDQLVIANGLHAGRYAIEINGSGNAVTAIGNELPDFTTRLRIVPEPELYAMVLIGIGLTGYVMRRRKRK